jgi:hypothetical protein
MKLVYLVFMIILCSKYCECDRTSIKDQLIQTRYNSRVFRISVFYDDTYDHAEDITKYSVDIINRQIQPVGSFEFDITLNKVEESNGYRLSRIICNEINFGRIAVVAIGNSPTFQILKVISTNLNIPYVAVRNVFGEEAKILSEEADLKSSAPSKVINMYPPGHKLVQSLTDLINHYKWKYVTVLYQESYGFDRIQNLIKITNQNQANPNMFKIRVRQLNKDIRQWIYIIKDIKSSGTSHIIVDIEPYLINEFVRQVFIVFYYVWFLVSLYSINI